MFNCEEHNWSHIYNPCPICGQVLTKTSDIYHVQPITYICGKCEKYEELKAAADELFAALSKHLDVHCCACKSCDDTYLVFNKHRKKFGGGE